MNTELRCPKCSSSQISADKKGFSGKKALGGVLLTGGVGLLAGTIGSNSIVMTCLACGKQFKPGEGKIISIDLENAKKELEKAKLELANLQSLSLKKREGDEVFTPEKLKEIRELNLKESREFFEGRKREEEQALANRLARDEEQTTVNSMKASLIPREIKTIEIVKKKLSFSDFIPLSLFFLFLLILKTCS